MASPDGVELVELRVLDGPNLYFTRPAVKLTVALPGWLEASEDRVVAAAERTGLPGSDDRSEVRPELPGTEARRRFVSRLAAHVTRSLAYAAGTNLAVRSRLGSEPDHVIVAFPWRRRGAAEALGREVVTLLEELLGTRRSIQRLLDEAARRLSEADPGAPATVPDPAVPVIAVTGTNGKTTTVRALSHF